jgi:hypothetical protein
MIRYEVKNEDLSTLIKVHRMYTADNTNNSKSSMHMWIALLGLLFSLVRCVA